VHPQHLVALAVNMLSSKENSHKHKNDLDKRGEYQKFGNTCIQMRELVIKSNAVKVIAHVPSGLYERSG
jgi:hypothetical protein